MTLYLLAITAHIPTECCDISPDILAPATRLMVSLRGQKKRHGRGATSLARHVSTGASGCRAGPGVQGEVCGCVRPGLLLQVYIGIQVLFHRSVLSLRIKVKQKLELTEVGCVSPGVQGCELGGRGQVCKA